MPHSAPAAVSAAPVFGALKALTPVGKAAHFTAAEWRRLAGFYGVIALLHVIGWGLFVHYSAAHPAMLGLGLAAYLFGLRHAFDVDHIAAVDDTVRFLLQKGQSPLGVGFFFSLGHSTVVLALAVALIFAASSMVEAMPMLKSYGGIIGATVSGSFLWLIGILNLLVLLDMLKLWSSAKRGTHSHAHLDELLAQRGLMNRLFGGRLQKSIHHSWQMYPLGLLFGLGFDTASEVALLAMTAGAATGGLPAPALLSLPILFAAGMSLMDTTDGVLMTKAYHWAFVNPLRKIFYNITTTGLSVAVALIIGSIQLLHALIAGLGLQGRFFSAVQQLNFGMLGYVIVGVLLLAWLVSALIWKFSKITPPHSLIETQHHHLHSHASGTEHAHRHFH